MAKEIATETYDEKYAATLTSPQDLIAYFARLGVDVASADDGIISIDVVDKETLIGKPFVMEEWRINASGKFGTFVSVVAMDDNGKRFVFNDGSTGVAVQLAELSAYREAHNHPMPYNGRYVKHGLRVSEYTYTDDNGKETPAKTFYLNW